MSAWHDGGVLLLSLAGCPLPPYDKPDTSSPAESVADVCVGAQATSWESFGGAFIAEECLGCHSVGAADRQGAPAGVDFDTVEQTWDFADEILLLAGSDPPSMPPDQGTTAADRERLRWWLGCGVWGT